MSYNYQTEKAQLFTEQGVKTILATRDAMNEMCELAGCCMIEKIIQAVCKKIGVADSWQVAAACDYLCSIGEFSSPNEDRCGVSYRIYRKARP